MTDTDIEALKPADDLVALIDELARRPHFSSETKRALIVAALQETPQAKTDHPFQPDAPGSQLCAVCGSRPNAKVHRPYSLDPRTARARTQAAYRRVLARYRAEDEATYQARMREAYAELDVEAGRARRT